MVCIPHSYLRATIGSAREARRAGKWPASLPLGSVSVRAMAAGDSLTFAGPFTESGILNALFTARLVGMTADPEVRRVFLVFFGLCRLVGHTEIQVGPFTALPERYSD